MNDIRKLVVLSILVAWMSVIGCGTKKVAVQPPPPQPQPTVTASNPTPPNTGLTDRTPSATTTTQPSTDNSRYPDKATRDRIDTLLARISDAYFDYDKHTLRPDAVSTLQTDSVELRDILKQYPDYKLVIEGHADERGSDEYNIGLGDARAKSAKDYLVQVGIPAQQLSVVSYGKEKPVCTEHDEACWQKNRRVHIVAANNRPG
jgi:peptidoglycan-associated lipoprotein